RGPDLSRPREGLEAPPRRAPLDPGLAPRLRKPRTRLGLRLPRSRRRRLRRALQDTQRDPLRRSALGRVGGQRHGPRVGCCRGAAIRWQRRLRAVGSSVRRVDAALRSYDRRLPARDQVSVPVEAVLGYSLERRVVDVDETEPLRVAEAPLEVVEEAPDE